MAGSGVNVDTGFLLSGEVNLPIPTAALALDQVTLQANRQLVWGKAEFLSAQCGFIHQAAPGYGIDCDPFPV